jgi:GNAT superfamily N-acetyltransferase
MNLILRQAQLKDIESITGLTDQLGYQSTTEKIRSRLSAILNHDDHCVVVVTGNEKIIGWIHAVYSLRVESDPFVEIAGLVVDEGFRRKGMGKMLVEKIIEWTRSKGNDKIRVRCNTVRKEAHIFYNSLGFSETKEQKIFDLKLD